MDYFMSFCGLLIFDFRSKVNCRFVAMPHFHHVAALMHLSNQDGHIASYVTVYVILLLQRQ